MPDNKTNANQNNQQQKPNQPAKPIIAGDKSGSAKNMNPNAKPMDTKKTHKA